MKRLFGLMGMLMVAVVLTATSYAADEGGKYAGEFLNIGVGGRALAMGGAYVGLANDGTAMYWNPAGMGGVFYKEVSIMAAPASLEAAGSGSLGTAQLGANYYYGGLVWSLGQTKVGFGMVQLSIGDIIDTRGLDYDDANSNTQWDPGERVYYGQYKDGSSIADNTGSDTETAYFVSLAQNFGPSLTVGVNAKQISMNVLEYKASGMGFDVGVMYRMNPGNPLTGQSASGLSIGAVVRNVTNTAINWTTDTTSPFYTTEGQFQTVLDEDLDDATIPLSVAGGAAFTLAGTQAFSLTLAGSMRMAEDGMDLGFGTEIMIANMLALRAGLTQLAGPKISGTEETLSTMSLSAGMGIRIANMAQVDYALTGLGSTLGLGDSFSNSLGAAHRISMSVRF